MGEKCPLPAVRQADFQVSDQKGTRVSNSSSGPEWVIDDRDRYARMRLIGWWDQARISSARVLVVGAGALGNEVLKNLGLLGIGSIVVIDLDRVERTNLTRSVLFREKHEGESKAEVAAAAIEELNPDCDVQPIHGNVLTDIGLGLVREMDVVIGCLDNREARLWVNRMCWKVGTPWIDGGIQEINGVAKVFRPPDGPCYECGMTELDYRLISLRYSCPLLKQEDILQGKVPTAPTIASIVGGLQVQEALKLLHELPSAEGSALVFNGAANRFYQTRYPVREDCLSHEFYGPPLELPLSRDATVAELFAAVEQQRGTPIERLELDRDFLRALVCYSCDRRVSVDQPRCLVNAERGMCDGCGMPMQSELAHDVRPDSELANRTLAELGIPLWDIVKLETADEQISVLLDGDRPAWMPPRTPAASAPPTGPSESS